MSKPCYWQISCIGLVLGLFGLHPAAHAHSPTALLAVEPKTTVTLDFPNAITFALTTTSTEPFERVQLEYGLMANNCEADSTLAVPPNFTPGESDLNVTWKLNMRRLGGSVPPGAQIWYRWLLTTASGVTATPKQQVQWLDSQYPWQTVTEGVINLHWYKGDQAFAKQLLATAVQSQARIARELNTSPNGDLHLYIYENTQTMQDAMIFEPSWTGGRAFPNFNTVLIGISKDNIDWGMSTIAHELNHIIVDAVFDSCYGGMPGWLSEGLAMYAEGQLEIDLQKRLSRAIKADTVFTMRELAGGFSEDYDRALLSYAQSYSLVSYLIETNGKDKMTEFLQVLASGYHYETALDQVYGLTPEALDVDWRAWIGAKPLPQPTAGNTPVPTVFPTYQPISGQVQAVTPTPQPTTPAEIVVRSNNSDSDLLGIVFTIGIGIACCGGVLVLALIIFWLIRRNKSKKD
jgi:hypothetical protein